LAGDNAHCLAAISARERRAKIVAAEGEYQAAVKLGQAAWHFSFAPSRR
jgi:hypothetical protein